MDSELCALITGVNGGVGRSLAEAFDAKGYRVIGTDLGPTARTSACEFYLSLDLREIARSDAHAMEAFTKLKLMMPDGKLHVLINNAAIQVLGGVDSLSREDWADSLNVNLLSAFFLAQGLLKNLEKGGGSIINIGSVHSRLTKKGFVSYSTTKAALDGLTRALAVDLGARVRVNAINPAAIRTNMLLEGFKGNRNVIAELESKHPTKTIGDPKEVANLALMIASKDLPFLSGSTITLDGAISCLLHDLN